MRYSKHVTWDWCHLCGARSQENVDVSYPRNAEHGGPDSEYIRICRSCGERIAGEAQNEIEGDL